ncbi:unnamed protein product [Calypogeia fissa]
MSKKMNLKESSTVVSAGQPLFTKFKSRTKDAESPKSVISDPRIVSPSSSASASLERRLTDLKKAPRHDRVHSISDADEENSMPGANLSAVLLSRQLSAKASNGHLLLESVSESHSVSTVHPRMGQISAAGSETSSPRVRMSRNAGKDGAKSSARGPEHDVASRRMSFPGAEITTSSAFSPLPHPTELPYEDQIELNKFVVRGSGGEDIRTGEHKIAWSPGTTREPHRNSFSGDGRSSVSGYRHSKTAKKSFSPGESPGHTNGFMDSPRSTLSELSSDFAMKATTPSVKDFSEIQIAQKDPRMYCKSTSYSDYFDRHSSTRLVDGYRKSFDGGSTTTLSAEGSPSDTHNAERSFQYGGKVPGGDASRTSLMPQQRFVPGQFLKSNPLKPRPSPAKWDDAEKWLVNSASVKSNGHSSYGNGTLSGGSTPQHATQVQAAASARYHNLPNSNQSSRMHGTSGESLPANTELYGARLLPENGDANSNTYPPTNVIHIRRSCDASTTTDRPEESLPGDAKKCDTSNRDETGTRPEDKFADSITVQSTSPRTGRVIIVMKDAATEITPSTSQRDIATQVTPAQSFHAAVTPPRLHNGGPARLNTTPVHSERRPASVGVDVTELKNCHQAKLDLDQAATLDTHWTTREEEVEESAKSLRLSVSRSVDFKEVKRNVLEARAAAWEEAEHSKYMARYHREEAKILAWEAHEKAKAEADMRKVEVKLEHMRSHANEILQNKLASVHLKAENMRAAAAAKCGEQAAKTNHWAQEIRDHGRSPSPTRLCCFPRFKSSYTQ